VFGGFKVERKNWAFYFETEPTKQSFFRSIKNFNQLESFSGSIVVNKQFFT
jgi:hypothetical protein